MKTSILIVIIATLLPCMVYARGAEQPPPIPAEEEPLVLTSGPVHEAFAEPVDLQAEEGIIVAEEPPDAIDETAPAEKPEGNYVWVPGYWAWDQQRDCYIWISGCWRAAPPNRYWVPGYWLKVTNGWQWVCGFWASTSNIGKIEYLPPPPVITDVQPIGVATFADSIWVPPCWYWYHNQYILRRGYWVRAQPNWIWIPSHYVWTPRGHVFVAGHWDYSLSRRGILFAPVYFPRRVYMRRRITYSLSIVMDLGDLRFGLFAYPRYHHYYFGDFYDDFYLNRGIYPWFEWRSRLTWYDPIYEHYRWRHIRREPRWEEQQRSNYVAYRANKDLRPSTTYTEMATRLEKMPVLQQKEFSTAAPLTTIMTEKKGQMNFKPINNSEQKKIMTTSTEVRQFSKQRSQWETEVPAPVLNQPITQNNTTVSQPTSARQTAQQVFQQNRANPSQSSSATQQQRQPSIQNNPVMSPPASVRQTPRQPSSQTTITLPPVTQQRNNSAAATARQNQINMSSQGQKADKVKTPTPPISNKPSLLDGLANIFTQSTPSQPAQEKKANSASAQAKSNQNSNAQNGKATKQSK